MTLRAEKTKSLTQLEFDDEDFATARHIARMKGYGENTAYTSTSDLWGLFCLPFGASQSAGCVIKTREFGMCFIQTEEDLGFADHMNLIPAAALCEV